ncbi:MAG: DUF1828 domain-containing protein [Candidatus Symbiobacter sp.]|nr:DUF1828 domain-containing protein [Candidatus Symbiobacter sp.]
MTETGPMLDEYVDWLRSHISYKQLDNWTEITTPFLDRHNDYIQIYVKIDGEGYLLSDGGETLIDLEHSGLDIKRSPKRKDILCTTLNGFGVKDEKGVLQVQAVKSNFALKKHSLIQAILAVNDMFFLASSNVTSLFFEEVEDWLNENSIAFIKTATFIGKSGFNQMFDYVIPKPKGQPEIIMRIFNNPTRQYAQNLIMAYQDIENTRPKKQTAIAVINDNEKSVPPKVEMALRNYNIHLTLWSRHQDDINLLRA